MSNKAEFEVVLDDEVSPGAKKASSSLKKLQGQFDKFKNSSVGKIAGEIGGALKTGLMVAGAAAAGVATGVAALTVGMVDFNQRAQLGFKALAQAGEDPQKSLQRTIDLIKEFGFDMKDTTAAVLQFKASGFTQDQSEKLLKMGADMRVLGANSEQVGRAFLAINQIKSAGTLQGDELNQLAEAGVPKAAVFEELAKAMGKTVPEILKIKEAGGIGAADAINAIGAAMLRLSGGKEFGDAGRKIANETISGMQGKLTASFSDMFRRVALKAEGPIVKALAPIGEKLMKVFEDPKTAEGLSNFITKVADAIGRALPFVEKFLESFGKGFAEAWPAVVGGLKMVVDFLGKLTGTKGAADTVAMVGKALGEIAAVLLGAVAVAIGVVGGAIVLITGYFNAWKSALTGFVNTLGAAAFAIVDMFANISAIFDSGALNLAEKAFEIGKQIVMGIVNGIKSLAMLPVNMLMGMAQSWIGSVRTVLDSHSPSRVFESIGMDTVAGFTQGVDGEMPTIQGMAGQMGNASGLTAGNGGGGGSPVFAPVITVPISGSATEADGQAFGSGITKELDRYFSSFIDRTALESAA